mgnify:CR=1 FL=1
MQNCAAPPFGGIFCIFWYKTYKDCEINNYQLNHLTKHGKIWLSIGGQSGKKKGDFKTMGYKSDIEIAQECTMQPITAIAEKAGIDDKYLEQYGKYKAKIDYNLLKDTNAEDGKLILVTAINPTPAGEGKTTTSVGLVDGLSRIGKKAMVALREPSLGPVFGVKGGAAGGGYAQVVPMEDINLHFTGDMHAITTANNLVSACLDNVIHQGNELNIDPEKVTFKRCLDMNDRTLRNITIGCGAKANGVERKDGFNITVASEIMAALCLADDLMDLKKRFGKMLVAYTYDDKPVYVHDLGIEGALAMVMKDAVLPNVVQTLEHNPVLIHGGPFANIAHGCNSVIATKACLELADYTVTEAGFGADLGAEKFLDIKCRLADLKPNAVVIVATIRALKQHGGIALEDLKEENVEAMLAGCENLAKHIDTVQQFGLPYIVAINEFATDTPAEVAALEKWCEENNHPMSLSQVWAKGGEGAIDLANKVVALCDQENNYAPLYDLDKTIEEKIETIAKKVYGADGVDFTEEAQAQIAKFNELGWDKLPICMAKTQMSLSDDGKVMGRPTGFRITVRELRPSLGAGFIVALTGKVLTMPGLPKHPSALDMDVDEDGKIMPLSRKYTSRVVVATGNISRKFACNGLYPFIMTLRNDEFWDALVEQIVVEKGNEVVLIPKVGNFRIVLGTLDDMNEKLENLRLFLREGIVLKGWNVYKEINLKFKNQIVCVKR